MRLPVTPQLSTKDGISNKNARLTNCLKEVRQTGDLAQVRPGLEVAATSVGNGNGLVCFDGELVSVFGATLRAAYEEVVIWERAFIGYKTYTDIIYENSLWLWVYNGGMSYSSDGVTWANCTGLSFAYFEGVAFGNGVFCAVSTNMSSTGVAYTSNDGISWTGRTIPNRSWRKIAFGNGIFIAVATIGNVFATSPDGITWTERSIPISSYWYDIQFDGVGFCVVGFGVWLTTTDGITWANGSLPSNNAHWTLSTNLSRFVAVDYYGVTSYSDDHGNTWSVGDTLGISKCSFYALGYFWVLSYDTAYKSVDGRYFTETEGPLPNSAATWMAGASDGEMIIVVPVSMHPGIRRSIQGQGFQTSVVDSTYDFAQSPL